MKRFKDKRIVITGASSGIGAGLAEQLAAEGAHLVLGARRLDRLQSLAEKISQEFGVKALPVICDVTTDEGPEALVKAAMEQLGGIDIVIANAGFGLRGAFERLRPRDFQRQFETNVFGVLKVIYACLREIKKNRGQIVIMSSVMGHVGVPFLSPYSMSKFALRGLAESIRDELAPAGIRVNLISPGLVESEMRQVDARGQFNAKLQDNTPTWLRVSTEDAVREMLNGIYADRAETVVTGHGKILVLLNRFFPFAIRAIRKKYLQKMTQGSGV